MKARVLHLTLKKMWFDMIASGEKKEEYREIKGYWMTRLLNKHNVDEFKNFDLVVFRNGYAKDAPTIVLEVTGIRTGYGNPEWGAVPGERYFVIGLGKVLAKY